MHLKRAVLLASRHIAHQCHQGNAVEQGLAQTGAGVGGTRTWHHRQHSWLARAAGVAIGHGGRRKFVGAKHIRQPALLHRVPKLIGLRTRDAVDALHTFRLQRLHQSPGASENAAHMPGPGDAPLGGLGHQGWQADGHSLEQVATMDGKHERPPAVDTNIHRRTKSRAWVGGWRAGGLGFWNCRLWRLCRLQCPESLRHPPKRPGPADCLTGKLQLT